MAKESLYRKQSTIHWLDKSIRPSSTVGMARVKYNWRIQGDINISAIVNLVRVHSDS